MEKDKNKDEDVEVTIKCKVSTLKKLLEKETKEEKKPAQQMELLLG